MLRTSGLLIFLMSFAASAAASGFAPRECNVLTLDPAPLWVNSATWSADGEQLLIVDVARRQVLGYPLSGGPAERWMRVDAPDVAAPFPSMLRRVPAGYLLEMDDGVIERRDLGFHRVESTELVGTEGVDGRLGSVNNWLAVGDHVLAWGDVQRSDGTWVSGLVHTSLTDPGELRLLLSLPLDDPGRDLYLVTNHYLTEIDGKVYFLLMGSTPSLWEIGLPATASGDLELRRVELPTAVGQRPRLAQKVRFDAVRSFYASLARATMPVGIYGWRGNLYLLSRNAAGEGRSRWTLTVLDPFNGDELTQMTLPTTAPHVQLVPGDESWAIIEKGEVEGLGVQKIQRAKVLPAKWLVPELSPLPGAAAVALCSYF